MAGSAGRRPGTPRAVPARHLGAAAFAARAKGRPPAVCGHAGACHIRCCALVLAALLLRLCACETAAERVARLQCELRAAQDALILEVASQEQAWAAESRSWREPIHSFQAGAITAVGDPRAAGNQAIGGAPPAQQAQQAVQAGLGSSASHRVVAGRQGPYAVLQDGRAHDRLRWGRRSSVQRVPGLRGEGWLGHTPPEQASQRRQAATEGSGVEAGGRRAQAPARAGAAARCVDSPPDWTDSRGYGCQVYLQAGHCSPFGDDGTSGSKVAERACCGCGGGRPCEDSPAGWVDRRGHDCTTYVERAWCSGDGGPGPGWLQEWGGFADQASSDGHTAATACCACRPPATDAGGRGCDYYALHPTHCGCCDDEDFIAMFACAGVCSAQTNVWPEVIAGWPNHTRHIIFPDGSLTGSVLAAEEWPVRFPRLRTVSVRGMGLQGTLPPELGSLGELRVLDLGGNQIGGSLPEQLGQLVELAVLRVEVAALQGTLPAELGRLPKLRTLDASANRINGTLPAQLGELAELRDLRVYQNGLTGTLPGSLGKLSKLQVLFVFGNRLTGPLPSELGALRELRDLDASNNQLTGEVPRWLGGLALMSHLSLGSNKFIGTLPAELGALAQLVGLEVVDNALTGTLPRELGNLTQLTTLNVAYNRLTGAVPSQLGALQQVDELYLNSNDFTQLPESIGYMEALRYLDVQDNPHLSGVFPNTSGCPNLIVISAASCNFTSAGAVGSLVQTVDFHGNSFGSLPAAWQALPSVIWLDLSDNKLGTWRPHGVLPLGTFFNYKYACGVTPLDTRLDWPKMQIIDLSRNPLGRSISARDFLWSLGYLPSLTDLRAAQCGLEGVMPLESPTFGVDMENTGDQNCKGAPFFRPAYQVLFTLDLSGNSLTALFAPPPRGLAMAKLHGNALTGVALHPAWYSILGTLEVWGNSLLRADVAPPRGGHFCSAAGTATLEADPTGWAPVAGLECTTLCVGERARYKHDAWLNKSSLCRCPVGGAGSAGTSCSGCPADTFSEAADFWGMVRVCRPCPLLSTTDEGVENATSVDQCKCLAGWYMGRAENETELACVRCPQKRFQTTTRGATREAECTCNSSYEGLRALQGTCGCVDGEYMDHSARRCTRCDTSAELCVWGADVQLSLLPPVVRAGYWVEPQPGEASTFSGNDIWRCVSQSTCPGGGACAQGRAGRACGLCEAGMYGGPDGPCRACPSSPARARVALGLGLLLGPAVTIAAHVLLHAGEENRRAATALGALGTSMKQSLKYVQMLAVMSGFSVDWPPLARQFMVTVSRITVAPPQLAGPACLTGQQSAALEMGFRWLIPVAGILSAGLASLILFPTRWCCRGRRWHAYAKMDGWDVLRVCLWGLVLFYSTLLQFGTQILACASSPNGKSTVLTFPHIECGGSDWGKLAAASCAFLAAFAFAVFWGVYRAWQSALHTLVHSNFMSRGWWGFLFGDFRHGSVHWAMLLMVKEMVLVIIATAGAGNGVAQLMATAGASTLYSYLVIRDQPYREPSNSVLEAWTSMSLAVLSVFSAGMGYQSVGGLGDVVQEPENTASQREAAMLAVQCLTMLGPVGIIVYQCLSGSERVRRRMPPFLRPMDEAAMQAWISGFVEELEPESAESSNMRRVLEQLDGVEKGDFRRLMGTTVATIGMGMAETSSSGIQGAGRRRMNRIAKHSATFVPTVALHPNEERCN